MSKIIIQRDDGCFDMLSDETRYEVKDLDLQIKSGFLCPYFLDGKVHQGYWNADKEAICFTHKKKKFDCESCPKLISSEIHPVMCFLTIKNDFIAYDLVRDEFIFLPYATHGCDSIDYVATLGSLRYSSQRLFFFWSIKLSCVIIYEWDTDEGFKIERQKWTDPTQPILHTRLSYTSGSYRTSKYPLKLSLLPAVKDDNSTENLRYVFATSGAVEEQRIRRLSFLTEDF